MMASERIQHRIEIHLSKADEAVAERDWARACDRAQDVLACAPRMN